MTSGYKEAESVGKKYLDNVSEYIKLLSHPNTPKEFKEKTIGIFNIFPFREREIMKLRVRSYTLEELGKIFKITRERVRQIEKKALIKMTKPEEYQKVEGIAKELMRYLDENVP